MNQYLITVFNYAEILYCYGIIGFILYYWKMIWSLIRFKKILYSTENMLLGSIFVVLIISDIYSISFLQPLPILFISLFMSRVLERD